MSNIKLTDEEKAILNHCLREGEKWASNATDAHVRGCIEEHRQSYLDAKAKLGDKYQTCMERYNEINRIRQEEYDNASYDIKRIREYPKIGEQLDMLWHAIDLDTLDKTSDFYNNLKAVKEKYPKGDS